MFDSLPEPWLSFLKELDAGASSDCAFHCIGGFVVTYVYGSRRTTSDLDVLSLPLMTGDDRHRHVIELGSEGSALHRKYGVYLDCVTVSTLPDGYEERLVELCLGVFRYLRLFAPDPYDLALSKLERNQQHDRDDVKHLALTVPLDLNLLQERYHTEMRPYLGRVEREDLTLKLWIEMIEEERSRRTAPEAKPQRD
jgi:hypothetical protein